MESACLSSSECAKDECCVLSMQRYSIPSCLKLRALGESCRPGNEPTSSLTVSYPSNDTVELKDVYMNLCDCSPELTCNHGTCESRP
ncbi:hypothetical protein GE061_006059 [Apolygus lucorum]|uniref:Astakine n=1 Tax=Apolygus lucorum TaxID=248454 RepID=A0A8S9WUH0_APOLU|nr:hypothetical protein GE061_006059 [Apolygus lucorum]